jgi:hypothetical protein
METNLGLTAFPFWRAVQKRSRPLNHPFQMIFAFGPRVQLGTNNFLSMNVAFRFA